MYALMKNRRWYVIPSQYLNLVQTQIIFWGVASIPSIHLYVMKIQIIS